MEKQPTSVFDRFSNWINGSISIKMATIGFLVLILMIPLSMIDSVISEREWRKQAVVNEISKKWSSEQVINGPILTIPYKTFTTATDDKGKISKTYYEHYFQLLPETLNITGPQNIIAEFINGLQHFSGDSRLALDRLNIIAFH